MIRLIGYFFGIGTMLALLVAAGIAIGVRWLWPQFGASRSVLGHFSRLSVWPVLLAAAAEAGSLIIYSLMSRTIFRSVTGGFRSCLAIDLTTTGLSHVLPTGGPAAAAARYRMFRRAGVDPEEALSGAAIQATIGDALLVVLLFGGLVLNVGGGATWMSSAPSLIVIVVILAGLILAGVQIGRHPTRPIIWVDALSRHHPGHPATMIRSATTGIVAQIAGLRADPRRSVRLTLFGLSSWVCDAFALWLILAAFGTSVGPGPLLMAYAIGNLMVLVPVTPGGLGLVEGTMVPLLISFGVGPGTALLGVLGWRIFQYWLPMPVAALAYLVFRIRIARLARDPVGPSADRMHPRTGSR